MTGDAARLRADGRGRGGMERRGKDADGAPGRGRGCGGQARGEGTLGGGARAEALVPGVGEGGCCSQEQNRRAGKRGLRRKGWAVGFVRTSGTAHHPTPSRVPFPRDPLSLPERPAVWEGPPAEEACVSAASAPGTGVARRREGKGLRGRDVSAGGARWAPGLGWQGPCSFDAFARPLSGLSPSRPPADPTVQRSRSGRARAAAGRGGGSAVGLALGGLRTEGRRAGGGGEGGNAKSWGLPGAGATSPRRGPAARPRAQEWGRSRRDPRPPPQRPPPPGDARIAELKACSSSGLALAVTQGWPRPHPGGLCRTRRPLLQSSHPPPPLCSPPARSRAQPPPGLRRQPWVRRDAPGSGSGGGGGALPAAAILQVWLVTSLRGLRMGLVGHEAALAPAEGCSACRGG